MSFTIGCDPEFFLRDKNSGNLVSAIPFIKGTKYAPELLKFGGNIQRDNVAVEVATDPAASLNEFIKNVGCTLKEAVKLLPDGHEIVALPSARFDKSQLKHPDALVFGCDPDCDAWSVCENSPPCASDPLLRSCGAHIHVGTTGADENAFLLEFEGKLSMVKIMDCLHGIISTALDSSEEAVERRKLYGKAGAHRPKEYGVEYRVLSNYWLKSPITVMMIYHLTQDALAICREKRDVALINEMGEDRIKSVINDGLCKDAMMMIEKHLLPILSTDSIFYFNETLAKIRANDMDLNNEWELNREEISK